MTRKMGMRPSNISRLLDFEPDYIKIDACFIRHLPTEKNCRIIVENVFDLGQRIGAEVIAEYVESQPIQDVLEAIGIHYSQGYLFSIPSLNFYKP
ncbi:EAL domain-containing protein [Deltaproteobacteria bacterium TL4]